jgi:hypothetical protein
MKMKKTKIKEILFKKNNLVKFRKKRKMMKERNVLKI